MRLSHSSMMPGLPLRGVRDESSTASYSYPVATAAHPHAVSQVAVTGGATTTYSYDNAGDTTSRGTGAVTWNAIGKPATVAQGSTTQSDVYDPEGNLLLQSDSVAGSTLFLGATELHVAVGSSTVRATRTYSRGSTPVAERSNLSGSTVLTWLLADQQNTVTAQLVDSSGALTVRRQDPFGQSRSGAAVAWGEGHGFLNAVTSTVTGLTQLGARLYDPAVGKFLSVDAVLAPFNPIQNNGYSYAGNNPITNEDPSGNYYVGGSLGNCSDRGCTGSAPASGGKKTPAAPGKGPDLGSIAKKAWDQGWNTEGQFFSGVWDGLYGIGKFFLWDANIGGATENAINQIGCVSNFTACHAQQEAAAAPWQKDFWGTFEKTVIQPTLDDFTKTPAHAVGELVPNLALFAIPGGGEARGAEAVGEAVEAARAADAAGSASAPSVAYARPSGATNAAQRASVQGLPCVDCGSIAPTQVADHITPLVKEYYQTGGIDLDWMRSVDAVQPQCPLCSARQGADLSRYSRSMRTSLGLDGP